MSTPLKQRVLIEKLEALKEAHNDQNGDTTDNSG